MASQIVADKQIRDCLLNCCHSYILAQSVEHHGSIRRNKAARWLNELSGETGSLEQAGSTTRDNLHVKCLGVGTAVQLQGGVKGDRAIRTQAGGCQKAAGRPRRRVGMLGYRCKTPRSMRRRLPILRCWLSIDITTLSSEWWPTAAAYSARQKTGCALKKDTEICRGTAEREVLR